MTLRDQDAIPAVVDGEEVRVHNRVEVNRRYVVSGEPSAEHSKTALAIGREYPPFYVTHWVADELLREFDIDVSGMDVEVVDVGHEDVEVL